MRSATHRWIGAHSRSSPWEAAGWRHGSRGSGKIEFRNLQVRLKAGSGSYRSENAAQPQKGVDLNGLAAVLAGARTEAQRLLFQP